MQYFDSEAIGQACYQAGVAVGDAMNAFLTGLHNIDWDTLAKQLHVFAKCNKTVYRKHQRPVLTDEEYASKSNNWLHMHGYPTRRHGGNRKCR